MTLGLFLLIILFGMLQGIEPSPTVLHLLVLVAAITEASHVIAKAINSLKKE